MEGHGANKLPFLWSALPAFHLFVCLLRSFLPILYIHHLYAGICYQEILHQATSRKIGISNTQTQVSLFPLQLRSFCWSLGCHFTRKAYEWNSLGRSGDFLEIIPEIPRRPFSKRMMFSSEKLLRP